MPSPAVRSRFVVVAAAFLVLLIVLGFTGVLTVTSFRQHYIESLVARYSTSARVAVDRIEYGLRYGKPIENYFGMEALLAELRAGVPDLSAAVVLSPAGEVYYDENGRVRGRIVAAELRDAAAAAAGTGASGQPARAPAFAHFYDGAYHLFYPVRDGAGRWVATLAVAFPGAVVDAGTERYTGRLLALLGILAAGGFVAFVLVDAVYPLTADGAANRRRFLVVALLLLGLLQAVYGWSSYVMLREGYLETARENVRTVAALISKDVDSVLAKGVPYAAFYQVDAYLERIAASVPEIGALRLRGEDGGFEFRTGAAAEEAPAADLLETVRLGADKEGRRAELQVVISAATLAGRLREIFLDNLTVLAVSLVLMVEAVIFSALFLERRRRVGSAAWRPAARSAPAGAEASPAPGLVRTVMLLLAVAVFMPSAFIPVMMKRLYVPILGLSENVVLSLPITAEMLFAGIAAVVAGRWVDKGVWKRVFLAGLAILACGLLLSAQAVNGLIFIAARSLSGVGYGFLMIALRGYINARPTQDEQSEELSGYVSGLYAGFIIGAVAGAMLADRFGYAAVFLVALGFVALGGLFSVTLVAAHSPQPASGTPGGTASPRPAAQGAPARGGSLWRFLTDRAVFIFFAAVVIPFTACSMFLDYFLPVYAAERGIETADVGRAFLVNGLAIAYVGPVLSRVLSRRLSAAGAVAASGLTIVAALGIFAGGDNFWTAFVAAFLLGISDGFGLVAQHSYYVALPAARDFGTGAALGYFDNMRKVGQMGGPLIFALALTWGAAGVGLIAAFALAGALLFYLTRHREGGPPALGTPAGAAASAAGKGGEAR